MGITGHQNQLQLPTTPHGRALDRLFGRRCGLHIFFQQLRKRRKPRAVVMTSSGRWRHRSAGAKQRCSNIRLVAKLSGRRPAQREYRHEPSWIGRVRSRDHTETNKFVPPARTAIAIGTGKGLPRGRGHRLRRRRGRRRVRLQVVVVCRERELGRATIGEYGQLLEMMEWRWRTRRHGCHGGSRRSSSRGPHHCRRAASCNGAAALETQDAVVSLNCRWRRTTGNGRSGGEGFRREWWL